MNGPPRDPMKCYPKDLVSRPPERELTHEQKMDLWRSIEPDIKRPDNHFFNFKKTYGYTRQEVRDAFKPTLALEAENRASAAKAPKADIDRQARDEAILRGKNDILTRGRTGGFWSSAMAARHLPTVVKEKDLPPAHGHVDRMANTAAMTDGIVARSTTAKQGPPDERRLRRSDPQVQRPPRDAPRKGEGQSTQARGKTEPGGQPISQKVNEPKPTDQKVNEPKPTPGAKPVTDGGKTSSAAAKQDAAPKPAVKEGKADEKPGHKSTSETKGGTPKGETGQRLIPAHELVTRKITAGGGRNRGVKRSDRRWAREVATRHGETGKIDVAHTDAHVFTEPGKSVRVRPQRRSVNRAEGRDIARAAEARRAWNATQPPENRLPVREKRGSAGSAKGVDGASSSAKPKAEKSAAAKTNTDNPKVGKSKAAKPKIESKAHKPVGHTIKPPIKKK